ncbi:MAG: CAP domain-containing protein [Thermoleophilia bacterium]|nr:CAP domain-containing protein [Thermoleophilia bacterium]
MIERSPHISVEFLTSRLALLVLLVTTMIAVLLLQAAPAGAMSVSAPEREQLHLINNYRAAHGLKRLRFDKRLLKTADWMAADMPRYDYFDHVDHLTRDPFARLNDFKYPENTWRGENLAAGNEDPQSTFQQWVDSIPHRENMLNPNYRAVGLSRVCNDDSQFDCYWVTEFGSKVVKLVR